MGYKPVVVLSGSMEPYMETNSIVIVEKTKDVGINDAIFFMQDGKVPIIHRVVRFDENGNIVTKGDANDTEDFIPVTMNSVEGKVVLVLNWVSPIVDLFL